MSATDDPAAPAPVGWGHINLDSVMPSDEPALSASVETTVFLVVDGQIVESKTGPNSERLDWAGSTCGASLRKGLARNFSTLRGDVL